MEQDLLSGVLALSLVLLNPSGATSIPSTSQIVEIEEMRDYVVKEGDTLSIIAEKEYGSIDFWTNIWNDNPWIENPNQIEKDWKIKIGKIALTEPATLNAELKEKVENRQRAVQPFPKTQPVSSSIQTAPVQAIPTNNYAGGPLNEAQITYLGTCESGMTASRNSGNGYYGAFQFSISTWNSMDTVYERADLAPLDIQKDAVQRLVARSSIYNQFPGCARKMQASGII